MFLQSVCSQWRIEIKDSLLLIIMVVEHRNILILNKTTQNKEPDGIESKDEVTDSLEGPTSTRSYRAYILLTWFDISVP
jgi:hypothetical protein